MERVNIVLNRTVHCYFSGIQSTYCYITTPLYAYSISTVGEIVVWFATVRFCTVPPVYGALGERLYMSPMSLNSQVRVQSQVSL